MSRTRTACVPALALRQQQAGAGDPERGLVAGRPGRQHALQCLEGLIHLPHARQAAGVLDRGRGTPGGPIDGLLECLDRRRQLVFEDQAVGLERGQDGRVGRHLGDLLEGLVEHGPRPTFRAGPAA